MPLVKTSFKKGRSNAEKKKIASAIHKALVNALGIPEKDFFHLLTEYGEDNILYDANYLGIERSENFMVIEITLRRGRSDAMKYGLYAEIASQLYESLRIKKEDIMIALIENDFSDWSLGNGVPGFKLSLNQQ